MFPSFQQGKDQTDATQVVVLSTFCGKTGGSTATTGKAQICKNHLVIMNLETNTTSHDQQHVAFLTVPLFIQQESNQKGKIKENHVGNTK